MKKEGEWRRGREMFNVQCSMFNVLQPGNHGDTGTQRSTVCTEALAKVHGGTLRIVIPDGLTPLALYCNICQIRDPLVLQGSKL